MAAEVFFTDLRAKGNSTNRVTKVRKLFEAAGFGSIIKEKDLTAVKLHFGERGGDAFINPIFVRQVVEKILENGGKPFLTDSNTLYRGNRHNAVDHTINAIEHGFDYSVVKAPIIIADGLKSKDVRWVEINGKHFDKVRIAANIQQSDSMIVMSHFKGHIMGGFGGAVKNLAMGGASAYGKMDQHSVRPEVEEKKCIGCKECMQICPVDAHVYENGKVWIDKEKCIGCGECIIVCQQEAIGLDWSSEIEPFHEKMAEYAFGSVLGKEENVGYINFLTRISPECDCFSWSDYPIVPDIGIVASKDPVAIDKACYDLVNQQVGFKQSALKSGWEPGEDKFRGLKPQIDSLHTLRYAEKLGLGTMDYELRTI
jgi:hypothetical protein